MNNTNPYAAPTANLLKNPAEAAESPLWNMDFKDLKKLYQASQNIQAMGYLNAVVAVLCLLAGFALLGSQPALFGQMLFAGVLCGLGAWISFKRPGWGRPVGIVLYALGVAAPILNGGKGAIGLIISIIVLIAFVRGKDLFGDDRIAHAELKTVYKDRKANES